IPVDGEKEEGKVSEEITRSPDEKASSVSSITKAPGVEKKQDSSSEKEASPAPSKTKPADAGKKLIDSYSFGAENIPINIEIYKKKGEFVPIYDVSISSISRTTEMMLEQIRKRLIKEVNIGISDITSSKSSYIIEEKFKETIAIMVKKFFPDADNEVKSYLTTYLKQKCLGMGQLEILMNDNFLEEITINSSKEPVWVYHKKHGWVKTNIRIKREEQIKHYADTIGRRVGRQVTVLEPLLDARLEEGDRANATIMPISTNGNTLTIRRFSREPFTITHFLEFNTISLEAAALIWLSMENEISCLIAGGTASGKTSTLNVLATFFPPNDRIISIEDTREIKLPKFLHWVPMNTRTASTEGTGEISMEHLLVNSLRMRPDRILVGEVRRKTEAETLFESIHTGHSCYATFHANSAVETVNRITNPPIDVPKTMMPGIGLVIVQFRNRRTGKRRTFQVAEILNDSTPNILYQYNAKEDKLEKANKSQVLFETLGLFTGFTNKEIQENLDEKVSVLKYLIENNIKNVDGVGRVMAEYYTDKENLMEHVKENKLLG
ncbi:MAG: type II/IV secretion system ATPase subunit, partial [Nanoarchaeota archaeon]